MEEKEKKNYTNLKKGRNFGYDLKMYAFYLFAFMHNDECK